MPRMTDHTLSDPEEVLMKQTYLMLAAVWFMFGCMAVVALGARRRSKRIDRWMEEDRRRNSH